MEPQKVDNIIEILKTSVIAFLGKTQNYDARRSKINERYLHHAFSHLWQQENGCLLDPERCETLMPEWPTWKQNVGEYSKYKLSDGVYKIANDGSSGFIDFVIGSCGQLEIGVEFKLLRALSIRGLEFDFLKLMDPNNPFQYSVMFAVILRKTSVRMSNATLDYLNERLKNSWDLCNNGWEKNKKRAFRFTAMELGDQGSFRIYNVRSHMSNSKAPEFLSL